jgi:chaperonin GroEL
MKKRREIFFPEPKQTPEVVFQPETARGFQGGINKIVAAITPSLGPFPRAVAIDRMYTAARSPEFLDSGGLIARRIIELPDRDENAGAMYIRGALWNLHERVGDGVATAALIFQTIFNQGLRYLATGGNAMILSRYLEKGLEIILQELETQVQPIAGAEALTGVAKTVCHDPEIATTLGKIINMVGEYGVVQIRAGRGRGIEQELVSGSFWPGALVSKKMMYDTARNRTTFENAAILITDLEIEEPQDLLAVIRAAVEAQVTRLVVMCASASEQVQGLMFQSKAAGKLQIIAVKVPGLRSDVQMNNMTDIALLTGGQVLLKAASDTLEKVTPEHFGRARRIWANEDYTGIVYPQGDPKKIRRHITTLRNAHTKAQKSEDRQRLQDRIGTLQGGAATIDVGGITETEMETRVELAKRTAESLRGAAREGILPGGGAALLACRDAVDKLIAADDNVDARAAHRLLKIALEAPYRTLMSNSGYQAGKYLGEIEQGGVGFGFDLISGQVREMIPAGIIDVAAVQKRAIISAIKGAALALTIDVLVHRLKPPMVTDPDSRGL